MKDGDHPEEESREKPGCCRRLFVEATDEAEREAEIQEQRRLTEEFLRQKEQQVKDEFATKWNFDVDETRPVDGDWHWEKVREESTEQPMEEEKKEERPNEELKAEASGISEEAADKTASTSAESQEEEKKKDLSDKMDNLYL